MNINNQVSSVFKVLIFMTLGFILGYSITNPNYVQVISRVIQSELVAVETTTSSTLATQTSSTSTTAQQTVSKVKHLGHLTTQDLNDLFRRLNFSKDVLPPSDKFYRYNVSDFFYGSEKTNEFNYEYLLKPQITECKSSKKMLLLVFVAVGVDFYGKRKAIRETWGNCSEFGDQMRVFFVLGLSDKSEKNEQVKREAEKYKDILLENMVDDYQKISIKVMGALKYVTTECDNFHFVLRINDDVVVNNRILLGFLSGLLGDETNVDKVEHGYIGNLLEQTDVVRFGKFNVPFSAYERSQFLPYMEGSAFIMGPTLAKNVYNISQYVNWPPFSISMEDTFVGMLCLHSKAYYMHIISHFSSGAQHGTNLVEFVKQELRPDLFYVYAHTEAHIRMAWSYLNPTNKTI